MQTFLPYPNYQASAECLDTKRLGKQRVECKQIYNALVRKTGWSNHPAVRMWRGYEISLCNYGRLVCLVWIGRGYRDTLYDFFLEKYIQGEEKCPDWLGDVPFHASHRAALLAKDYEWYKQFGWTENPDINYVWPKSIFNP